MTRAAAQVKPTTGALECHQPLRLVPVAPRVPPTAPLLCGVNPLG